VKQDDKEPIKNYSLVAEAGDPDGRIALGLAYADGRGVEKDEAVAVKWLRKASAQGRRRV
jgi:TPR repeat protein